MTRDALIGGTGFVGGHLLRQHRFARQFNSRNMADSKGCSFDTVVCAAAPGSMFEANNFPERDKARIDALCASLDAIDARRFVLISSVAVLADFAGRDDETTTAFQNKLAYGRHRRLLETFCETRFADCLVVRLPALFGTGLRKNFIFDLLNPMPSMLTEARFAVLAEALEPTLRAATRELYAPDPSTGLLKLDRAAFDACPMRARLNAAVTALGFSATQFHHPELSYQYYDMSRLWTDIGVATKVGLGVIHLATEPLQAARIHAALTGNAMPETGARLHREDMHTRHSGLWGRTGPYLEDTEIVLERLRHFFRAEQDAAA